MITPRPMAVVVSGHTMALAVVRALGEAGIPVGVVGYDERDFAQASRYVLASVRVPSALHDEAGFIDALLDARGRLGGSVLIPASDESVVALSRNRERLAEHFKVACPPWDVTQRFIDKSRTYELAGAAGVAVPKSIPATSAASITDEAAAIGYPLLLKPAESHLFYERFRRKMTVVETPEMLRHWYARAQDAGLAVMLQEIIPGDDSSVVNYNAYVSTTGAIAEFTARQLRKAPPHFGSPRVVRSEWLPDARDVGRRALQAIGFTGFACVELKLDHRDGAYKLLEVNGRHNLSGLLAVRSGVNFPLIEYRNLVEGVEPSGHRFRSGVHWTDVFRDAGYTLAFAHQERYRPQQYVAPYARHHCDAIVDRHDLGPARKRLGYLLRHGLTTLGAVRAGDQAQGRA